MDSIHIAVAGASLLFAYVSIHFGEILLNRYAKAMDSRPVDACTPISELWHSERD